MSDKYDLRVLPQGGLYVTAGAQPKGTRLLTMRHRRSDCV